MRIPAFLHHLTDYLGAAEATGLMLRQLREWWPPAERARPPQLVSFLFDGPALADA